MQIVNEFTTMLANIHPQVLHQPILLSQCSQFTASSVILIGQKKLHKASSKS